MSAIGTVHYCFISLMAATRSNIQSVVANFDQYVRVYQVTENPLELLCDLARSSRIAISPTSR